MSEVTTSTEPAREPQLDDLKIFETLDPSTLAWLADHGQFTTKMPGDTLRHGGSRGNHFEFLFRGVAEVVLDTGRVVHTMRTGEAFGHTDFFDDAAHRAHIHVVKQALLFRLPHQALREGLRHNGHEAETFLAVVLRQIASDQRKLSARLRQMSAHQNQEFERAAASVEKVRLEVFEGVERAASASEGDLTEAIRVTQVSGTLTSALWVLLIFYGRTDDGFALHRDRCARLASEFRHEALTEMLLAYGLLAQPVLVPKADLPYLGQPMLQRREDGHCVVIAPHGAKHIREIDPIRGTRVVAIEALEDDWVLQGFELRPVEHVAGLTMLHRIREVIRPYRTDLLLVAALSLVGQLLMAILALFTGLIIQFVLPTASTSWLHVLATGMLVVVALQPLLYHVQQETLLNVTTRATKSLFEDMIGFMMSLRLTWFEAQAQSAVLRRFESMAVSREILGPQVITGVMSVPALLVSFALLLSIDVRLSMPVLAFTVMLAIVLRWMLPRVLKMASDGAMFRAVEQERLMELIDGVETVRTVGDTDRMTSGWWQAFSKRQASEMGFETWTRLSVELVSGVRYVLVAVLLTLGAHAVLSETMGLATMVMGLQVADGLLLGLTAGFTQMMSFVALVPHLQGINQLFQEHPEDAPDAVAPRPLQGDITLEDVSYRYPDGPEVLKNVDLKIRAGMQVGLVGDSGSGKSTLGKILLGLYTPSQGRVLFDGQDLRALRRESLRRQFGVVLQSSFVAGGSIRHVISASKPMATLAEIEEAANIAAIDQDIAKLSMRYETVLPPGGGNFSGGQLQRLCIAQAVIHKPAVLLLDEATSALDNHTQHLVQSRISQMGSTQIVIAHRLSTVRHADLIVFLRSGRIIETGTHDELVEQGGAYAAFVAAQDDTASTPTVHGGQN